METVRKTLFKTVAVDGRGRRWGSTSNTTWTSGALSPWNRVRGSVGGNVFIEDTQGRVILAKPASQNSC